MSRVFVCLFVLFFLSIAVQFGDCENVKPECEDENIKPGSDKVHLSPIEAGMKKVKSPFDKLKEIKSPFDKLKEMKLPLDKLEEMKLPLDKLKEMLPLDKLEEMKLPLDKLKEMLPLDKLEEMKLSLDKLKEMKSPFDKLKEIKSPFDKMGDLFGKNKKDSQESSGEDSRENSQEEPKVRGSLTDLEDKMRAIFPGTKWCGDGDIAANDTDLGKFKEVDACCREHDKCTINIEAGKMLGNLMNDGLFTKSACTCDSKFHSCLKATSSFMDKVIAKEIGMMYFGMLQPQCFQCMCPAEGCNLKEMDCMDGCKKYEWVDNEKF